MQEKYEQLRRDYNNYSYSQLKDRANTLCNEAHDGKSFIEVYQSDTFSSEDLIDNIIKMHRRIDLQEMNKRVSAERVTINKPKTFIQAELGVIPDSTTTLMDLWREKWDMRIVHQEVPRDLYFLSFVSQLFNEITIYKGVNEDIRLHVCLIMPSGTGKSDGNDILSEVCKLANLSTHYLDRYSDAILTGSIDQKKNEANLKKGYKPGDAAYQDPIQRSVLELYNFIIYDEAENILKTTPATEGAQRHLQKAMNRRGSAANRLTNSLVGNSIECYPNCNIIMTSYYMSQFKDTLLERGLLQRMVVYISPENEEQRSDIINCIIDSVPTFVDDISEAEEKKAELERINKEINDKILVEIDALKEFHRDTKSIYIKAEAAPVIKDIIIQLREILPMEHSQRPIWNSMISRLSVNILKMSALFAIVGYRKYITEQDVRQAADILIKTMDSVGYFLKDNMKKYNNNEILAYHTSLKKSEKVGIMMEEAEMIQFMIDRFKITKQRAKMVLESLIGIKKIQVNMNNGVRKVKIVA